VQSDDGPETMAYYLAERVDAHTVRLIGFITVEAFDEACTAVGEGEDYTPTGDERPFTSRADNLVAEPADLWLSYRD
jgi:hypothetical protein